MPRHYFLAAVMIAIVLVCRPGSLNAAPAVSNLANSSTGAASVDSNPFGASTAGYFITGALPQNLAGATIRFAGVTSAYANFALSLYTESGINTPGTTITTLVGSAPTGAGDFVFTDPSDTALAASTRYWLVGSTTSGEGTWATTTDPTESSALGWTIGNTLSQRSNFNGFWQTFGASTPLFSVDIVPEPGSIGLALLCAMTAARRWR